MDDPGAIAALPALGHFGDRQRAPHETGGSAMVSAVAIRPMARRQRALNSPFVRRLQVKPARAWNSSATAALI